MVILGISIVFVIIIICLAYQYKIKRRIKEGTIGCLTNANGGLMNVYIEGRGNKTLIFMSGGGTVSPLLDFKSLYSRVSNVYKIVVIEKFGYGFSDILDKSRDIDSILNDTRQALKENQILPPYTLCSHSMSGIEALYWKQVFPEEIEAIIGLDMATPKAYENSKINQTFFKVLSYINKTGISLFIPKKIMGDAVKYGDLTHEEKKLYKEIFGTRFMSKTMLNEISKIKLNAEKIVMDNNNQTPMLLFVSNGIGTGFKKDKWQKIQNDFCSQQRYSKLVYLSCPHYVHNYEYKMISTEIIKWLGLE